MAGYIKGIFTGTGSLLTGLKVTFREFFTKKITEQYPENRATLKMNDRRAVVQHQNAHLGEYLQP